MYANISEWHKKIIDMYGKFDGYNFYLDTNRSKTKAPVFTQFFLESDFEPNKTFFVCKDLRVFLACAKPYDSFDTDKDFFNAFVDILRNAKMIKNEALQCKEEYSLTKDFLSALALYLRLS